MGEQMYFAQLFPFIKQLLRFPKIKLYLIIGGNDKNQVQIADLFLKKLNPQATFFCTSDGSYGQKGDVVDVLSHLIGGLSYVDGIIANLTDYSHFAEFTEQIRAPCTISIAPMILDGELMCVSCHLDIFKDNERRNICQDGHLWDVSLLDWQKMARRVFPESRVNSNVLVQRRRRKGIRPKMPRQDAQYRISNFDEVLLGLTPAMAMSEANRCLNCKAEPCRSGCPVGVNIRRFIELVRQNELIAAAVVILEDNPMPRTCGRVCPQEVQCEFTCVLNKKKHPIAIGALERFVCDYYFQKEPSIHFNPTSSGKSVAIVGAGPAGLSAARFLVSKGHRTVVFDGHNAPGGIPIHEIPGFRLEKSVVKQEVARLINGMELVLNHPILSIDELSEFDAILLCIGSGGRPTKLGLDGEDLVNVFDSRDFLQGIGALSSQKYFDFFPISVERNDMNPEWFIKKKFIVVGGGNVATDAARAAKRLGGHVSILYRKQQTEMTARVEDIEACLEEEIDIISRSSIIQINGQDGRIKGVLVKGPEGEKDMDVDVLVVAIGSEVSFHLAVQRGVRKSFIVDDHSNVKDNIFAAGDCTFCGYGSVVRALSFGRRAGRDVHYFLERL